MHHTTSVDRVNNVARYFWNFSKIVEWFFTYFSICLRFNLSPYRFVEEALENKDNNGSIYYIVSKAHSSKIYVFFSFKNYVVDKRKIFLVIYFRSGIKNQIIILAIIVSHVIAVSLKKHLLKFDI